MLQTRMNHPLLRRLALLVLLPLLALTATPALADGKASFDLTGPTLHVLVTRGRTILPAAEVPALSEGDKIWIKPEFPKSQSAHYLMIAAFLRGSTNPPPEDWFYSCKAWTNDCEKHGMTVTVPEGAEQMLVFLAPETNGDLKTLINAVQGRPGAFVRATQELNQAALDRSRLDAYLAQINHISETNPTQLNDVAPLLARSLSVKVDESCLEKKASLQAACLTAGRDSLILSDGHSMTLSQTLTEGTSADLVLQAAALPESGAGAYSPYVSTVLDLVQIFGSFTTAQYEYIPTLITHQGDALKLSLNAVPSFYDPKSVLVVAMPAIEKAPPPPLRAVDPNNIFCASRTELVLPVTGAPLVYSTDFAHDVSLHLTTSGGKTINLRATPDPARGGYVVNTASLQNGNLGNSIKGSIRGLWGFGTFEGPTFELRNADDNAWSLANGDENALIVGRDDTVHLKSSSVSCVDQIMLKDPDGKELHTDWKAVGPNEVEVTLPLQNVQPGALQLLIGQSGVAQPMSVPLKVFSAPASIDSFTLHAGDTQGILTGTRLDEVSDVSVGDILFAPGDLSSDQGKDKLMVHALDAAAVDAMQPTESTTVMVTLKDGRTKAIQAAIAPPRPAVQLLAKSIRASQSSDDSHIELSGSDEVPNDAVLAFSVRAITPKTFSRDQAFEVATDDESFTTTLSIANGAVRLENSKVALVTLNPAKSFGFSAFGPLKLRPVAGGIAGDWQPLATLVRLPALRDLSCPYDEAQPCRLSGSDLFLIDAIAGDKDFKRVAPVPDGFPGTQIKVPQPQDGQLYVRLRDNPDVVNTVTLKLTRTGEPPKPPEPKTPEPAPAPAAQPAAPAGNAQSPAADAGTTPAAAATTAPASTATQGAAATATSASSSATPAAASTAPATPAPASDSTQANSP